MENNKEMAMSDFCGMIRNSWTYQRMTAHEKAQCLAAIQWAHDQGFLRGNYSARWGVLHSIYTAYLFGLGYDGFEWRDSDMPIYDHRYVNPSDDASGRAYKWGETD